MRRLKVIGSATSVAALAPISWLLMGLGARMSNWPALLVFFAGLLMAVSLPRLVQWLNKDRWLWPAIACIALMIPMAVTARVPADWYLLTYGERVEAIVVEVESTRNAVGSDLTYTGRLQRLDGSPIKGELELDPGTPLHKGTKVAVVADPHGIFDTRSTTDLGSRTLEITAAAQLALWLLLIAVASATGAKLRPEDCASDGQRQAQTYSATSTP